MLRSDFHFDLPSDLIAQTPPAQRGDSRLLLLDRTLGTLQDKQFADLLTLLKPNDLLVLNNTKVIPARLFGAKESGGQVEILLERILAGNHLLVHLRANRSPKPGSRLRLHNGPNCQVLNRQDSLFELYLETSEPVLQVLERCGQVPLPPYIKHKPQANDVERYQTVFADLPGAVAAPTAGLHFSSELLQALNQQGVQHGFITLHVGAGTFQPVRSEHIEQHTMHSEWADVSAGLCEQIAVARQRGGRIVAVGTTVVRSLETASSTGALKPFQGETQIFIRPGHQFRAVDALVTNFHLPESTLLMLVAAFAGYNPTMAAYKYAVEQQYRFFSYGDAMLIS